MKQPLPSYMERGSRGPFVNIILAFMAAWYTGVNSEPSGIVLDKEYAAKGTEIMSFFQKYYALEIDGGFGPLTRAKFERVFGVKIDDLAELTKSQEPTIFVQPFVAESYEMTWHFEADEVEPAKWEDSNAA